VLSLCTHSLVILTNKLAVHPTRVIAVPMEIIRIRLSRRVIHPIPYLTPRRLTRIVRISIKPIVPHLEAQLNLVTVEISLDLHFCIQPRYRVLSQVCLLRFIGVNKEIVPAVGHTRDGVVLRVADGRPGRPVMLCLVFGSVPHVFHNEEGADSWMVFGIIGDDGPTQAVGVRNLSAVSPVDPRNILTARALVDYSIHG
jgi:hypothetical protein